MSIALGKKYKTFNAFKASLKKFQDDRNVIYKKTGKITIGSEKNDLRYRDVKFKCKGLKENRDTLESNNCPAFIHLQLTPKEDRLCVKEMNNNHNHPLPTKTKRKRKLTIAEEILREVEAIKQAEMNNKNNEHNNNMAEEENNENNNKAVKDTSGPTPSKKGKTSSNRSPKKSSMLLNSEDDVEKPAKNCPLPPKQDFSDGKKDNKVKSPDKSKKGKPCIADQSQQSPEKGKTTKREDYLPWEDYFMAVALLSAKRSKDPSTQVGACIVSPDKKVVGMGYNGMPIGCSDDILPWEKEGGYEKTKYAYVCHAELNAILNKNSHDVKGCTLYVSMFPCNECAKLIVQSRIIEVVYLSDKHRDQPGTIASKKLLSLAKVSTRQFFPKFPKLEIDFTKV